MDKFPSKGMTYEQGLKRGVRFVKERNDRLACSVINQVKMHEGEKAARELAREIVSKGEEQHKRRIY